MQPEVIKSTIARSQKVTTSVAAIFTVIASLAVIGLAHSETRNLQSDAVSSGEDWPTYQGSPGQTHYSKLDQINTKNVAQLQPAWVVDTGDGIDGASFAKSDMEANLLVVNDRMYVVSPKGRLFCIEPATGKVLWIFAPAGDAAVYTRQRLRGVAYWSDNTSSRILFTFRQSLMAVDAVTGQLIKSFGKEGNVDLREGLERDPNTITVTSVTPGTIYKDLLILGTTSQAPGHIRAYDVRTGAIRWIFHTIPHPGEAGYETWPPDAWKTAVGANSWAGMTLDVERSIVFVPVASAGMANKDFYGADRLGDNLYGTSLVALDANTGKHLWHFQFVHHDLWDRDPPSPPTLINLRRKGRTIPAVAQPTKAGYLFVLDRLTGKPLFPVEEHPAFASDVPGEVAAATQPIPLEPAPFARQRVTEDILTNRTPAARQQAKEMFAKLRSRGPFDPPSLQGTLHFPGFDGGAEYGGAAYDPETGLLYINANEMPAILKLRPKPPADPNATGGRAIYMENCASCHGADRKGNPPAFPSLIDVSARIPVVDLYMQVISGGGRMPGFPQLGANLAPLMNYVLTGKDDPTMPLPTDALVSPRDAYVFDSYNKFVDSDGYPAVTPPWGTLNAINVNTGKYVWKKPFGEYPELVAQGLTNTGSENYGGAVVTKGGLLAIGATVYDNKFHIYDKRSGALLWETILPAAGVATPSTYMAKGKQYFVICAGGGKNPAGKADGKIMAFTLPSLETQESK
jgi:quinoprotein glucose dehydrogenase